MQVPVLLIIFNRPDHTRRVLETVLAAEPQDLCVFQDGSRKGNEDDEKNCTDVRQVVENLTEKTQDCLHMFYSDKNLSVYAI